MRIGQFNDGLNRNQSRPSPGVLGRPATGLEADNMFYPGSPGLGRGLNVLMSGSAARDGKVEMQAEKSLTIFRQRIERLCP
jgi:hypothetical protein